eukprot:scaffold17755_cov129-Isochrysis_galbana.AAC.5
MQAGRKATRGGAGLVSHVHAAPAAFVVQDSTRRSGSGGAAGWRPCSCPCPPAKQALPSSQAVPALQPSSPCPSRQAGPAPLDKQALPLQPSSPCPPAKQALPL